MDPFDGVMYAYRAVFKQTDVGGGKIKCRITARERTVILYGSIGPDDYAADRTIGGWLFDGTNSYARILFELPIDNASMSFPLTKESSPADKAPIDFANILILGRGDSIVLSCSTPVQNEEMTVVFRCLVHTWPPLVASTGSAGTVTITVDYSKVI